MSSLTVPDDLSRNVYCLLGIPIDAIEMPTALRRIEAAVMTKARFVISTANLNFLVDSQTDAEFREFSAKRSLFARWYATCLDCSVHGDTDQADCCRV